MARQMLRTLAALSNNLNILLSTSLINQNKSLGKA